MPLTSIGTLGSNTSSFYQSVSGSPHSSTLAGMWSGAPSASEADAAPPYDGFYYRRGEEDSFHRLEAVVGDALNSAVQLPAADPHEIIQDAVEQAFQSSADDAPSAARGSSPSAAGSSTAAAIASPATRRFLAALRSYGVDPQQFNHDLVVAVQDAREGHVDPSSVLRSFPVGSSLDAVA